MPTLKNLTIKQGFRYPMGASFREDGVNLTVIVKRGRELYLCLYDRKSGKKEERVLISPEFRSGKVYCFVVSGIDFDKYSYAFYDGVKLFCDPYAVALCGCEKWGLHSPRALFPKKDSFDWEGDIRPRFALKDIFLYTLHVRGFTKHASSKVKYKGCFEGIVEKIPYLNELGVNQIELLPAYDFNEVIKHPEEKLQPIRLPAASKEAQELDTAVAKELEARKKISINYWGFADSAFYFSPKLAYSGTGNAAVSMKSLVKELHKAGIEIVMQFYFTHRTNPQFVIECIRYWVTEYHIDGVSLMGENIPVQSILSDPFLADTKLYMRDLNQAGDSEERYTALVQDGFMSDMRRFLKSDEDMLRSFAGHINNNPKEHGVINNITSYYGFTLSDLVSYDRKHNEDNGENNRDGSDYNFSWNCGFEGSTRKKHIRQLRKKQIFSALTFLYMSMGVPRIVAGDEFGNSQQGNNNAYCQDNKITWLDWRDAERNGDILSFVKNIIAFRKKYKIFQAQEPKTMMDIESTGYPDLSFHGEQAWYPHFESYSRSISCLYTAKDEFVLCIFNMYWLAEPFALPKLPKGKQWYKVMTSADGFYEEPVPVTEKEKILVPDRCCMILTGK